MHDSFIHMRGFVSRFTENSPSVLLFIQDEGLLAVLQSVNDNIPCGLKSANSWIS